MKTATEMVTTSGYDDRRWQHQLERQAEMSSRNNAINRGLEALEQAGLSRGVPSGISIIQPRSRIFGTLISGPLKSLE